MKQKRTVCGRARKHSCDSVRGNSVRTLQSIAAMAAISVVGWDVGNQNCVIALAKRGGVDVVNNESSKRLTP
jgi:hypothetical protein